MKLDLWQSIALTVAFFLGILAGAEIAEKHHTGFYPGRMEAAPGEATTCAIKCYYPEAEVVEKHPTISIWCSDRKSEVPDAIQSGPAKSALPE
jgi:hypothetical protein